MRVLFTLGLMAVFAVITGCVNNANIDPNEAFWQHKPSRVVIVTTRADKPQYIDSNAANKGFAFLLLSEVSTRKLDAYLSQMDLNWYYDGLAEQLKQALAKENIKGVVAEVHPYVQKKSLFDTGTLLNKPQLAGEYNADQVLVLNMPYYGARTPQQANLFGSAPPVESVCILIATLSDPQGKNIYWRHTSRVTRPVLADINQPPAFPNLTQSILDSQKLAVEELLDSFSSGR